MALKINKEALYKALAQETELYVRDNFRRSGLDGQPWPARKSRDKSDRRNPDQLRRLLTKTRKLERGLRVQARGGRLILTSDVDYAQIHNEGGVIKHPGGTPYISIGKAPGKRRKSQRIGRMGEAQVVFMKKDGNYPEGTKFTQAHDIRIPPRPFFKDTPQLRQRLERRLVAELKKQLQ